MTDSTWSKVKWRKSSRSAGSGDCVEVAMQGDEVAVRDSKSPNGAILIFSRESWQSFLHWINEEADDHRAHSE